MEPSHQRSLTKPFIKLFTQASHRSLSRLFFPSASADQRRLPMVDREEGELLIESDSSRIADKDKTVRFLMEVNIYSNNKF
jgi:hypothetical protein